eukprot:scaffold2459_cov72-Phaeocystis_antarctica.AAC.6
MDWTAIPILDCGIGASPFSSSARRRNPLSAGRPDSLRTWPLLALPCLPREGGPPRCCRPRRRQSLAPTHRPSPPLPLWPLRQPLPPLQLPSPLLPPLRLPDVPLMRLRPLPPPLPPPQRPPHAPLPPPPPAPLAASASSSLPPAPASPCARPPAAPPQQA